MSFVHLHNHTHYSLLDGLSKPQDLVAQAANFGCPAMAITDHGVLYGAIEFYKEAKSNGIKPIIGCEMYITDDRFVKDNSTKKSNHLLLLAKNEVGYQNLMQLVTKAHIEGFYYKPRIDHKLLAAHSEGLIATSGCLIGEIPQALLENDFSKAMKITEEYQNIFGKDNFYFEVQYHPEIDDQIVLNNKVIELAGELKIPLVATNDCHYVKGDDAHAHDILVCIQTGKTLLDDDRMKYLADFSFASPDEMRKAFEHVPEACDNTLRIAEQCDLEIKLGQNLLPKFKTPDESDSMSYLRKLCEKGIEELYKENLSEARKRLDYELEMIGNMGFADYFLIVYDFINYAKSQGIVVGPGRGSAAGSIIAYALQITTVDPLKYGLIFERFLNPDRVSMPDIDIDFADHRRDEILQYVIEKYGRDNVAQVITFGTMAAKAAVRDVGRAMGYPYAEVDTISKLIPAPILGKHRPLAESIKDDPALSREYETNPRAKELLDNAVKLEGTIRHAGTHACAVIISELPLVKFTPLQVASGKDDSVVTQYSMKPLEEIGLLKMDFLGLRNLTIIEHTLRIIKQTKDVNLDLDKIELDNELTFELLSKGETTGVFQLESNGMKRYLKLLKPTRLEDIIAMNALYRPGPMDYIPAYIKGKHDEKSIKYMHPLFEPILSETYGVGVYQEQILEIAKVFAGFTLGEADLLRKAVGKKDPVLLADQRQKFVDGATSQGHDQKFARKVFDEVIEPFAGYGFNKAHATCYAMIAYQTAYLKAHYPTEFMAALLTSDLDNTDRIVIEIGECATMGIEVLPPDINQSQLNFTVVNDETIRFGLGAIKGIGESTVEKIIDERNRNGIYKSIEDFCSRVPSELINKKTTESLSYSGAFDSFGDRHQLAVNYDVISKFAKSQAKTTDDSQISIFETDAIDTPEPLGLKLETVSELTRLDRLKYEKQYLGLYVSAHPLQGLNQYLSRKVTMMGAITKSNIGKKIKVGGIIVEKRKILTKRGGYMMYLTLEDPTGEIEVVIFTREYNKFADKILDDRYLIVDGKLELRRGLQVIASDVSSLSIDVLQENAIESGMFNENEIITKKVHNFEDDSDEEDEVVEEMSISNEPYEINLSADLTKVQLEELKKILVSFPGEVSVQLNYHLPDGKIRKIKVAQKINVCDDFKDSLAKVLKE